MLKERELLQTFKVIELIIKSSTGNYKTGVHNYRTNRLLSFSFFSWNYIQPSDKAKPSEESNKAKIIIITSYLRATHCRYLKLQVVGEALHTTWQSGLSRVVWNAERWYFIYTDRLRLLPFWRVFFGRRALFSPIEVSLFGLTQITLLRINVWACRDSLVTIVAVYNEK